VTPSPDTSRPSQILQSSSPLTSVKANLAASQIDNKSNSLLPPGVVDIDRFDIHGYSISPDPSSTTSSSSSGPYCIFPGAGQDNNISRQLYHLEQLTMMNQHKTNTRVCNSSTNNVSSAVFLDSYGSDYYNWCFQHEKKYAISNGYIERQKSLTESMRGILVDWLVELTEEYRLQSQTLFQAVNLVDRYLMVKDVDRSMLQCLGCACMLISAKYEEIHPPQADDFVYISDNTYTRQQITKMECDVVGALEFRLAGTTMYHFNSRFVRASGGGMVEQVSYGGEARKQGSKEARKQGAKKQGSKEARKQGSKETKVAKLPHLLN